jgi:hypothetical protein
MPNGVTYVIMRIFSEESERKGDAQYSDFIGKDVCNLAMKWNLKDAVEGRRALLFLAHNNGNSEIVNYFWGACVFEYYDGVANRVIVSRVPHEGIFAPSA